MNLSVNAKSKLIPIRQIVKKMSIYWFPVESMVGKLCFKNKELAIKQREKVIVWMKPLGIIPIIEPGI